MNNEQIIHDIINELKDLLTDSLIDLSEYSDEYNVSEHSTLKGRGLWELIFDIIINSENTAEYDAWYIWCLSDVISLIQLKLPTINR